MPVYGMNAVRVPIMKEILRLDAEGKLTPEQKKWMADTRPPEELYDVAKERSLPDK